MTRTPINDPTPRAATNGGVRLAGTLVIAALVLAIILLALDVITFEQLGFF
ncbi:hypothetical protein [Sphingomonas arenae]|uniref:hypothetical protein n=1 Tax=Sphingomonas arenae TaxID=2812555 RepID=UPI0019687AD5|nr:hypothetical protein [Sphingomonas arenae]